MHLTAGTKLGPYEILSPLGAGGMAEVYKALDTRLGRTVAVKQLNTEHSARFQLEARAIAALNHPHICQIYDIGPDYLVLEYVEGAPVEGPMLVADAVRAALQIAGALEAAHGKQILHRDLKPANILMSPSGVKLLDFGLAKRFEGDDATLTAGVSGTPLYMSPEQAEGKQLDPRSDVFSFGSVLYELLAGRRAFDSMAALLRDQPQPLAVPAGLQTIVARCLNKNPAGRFSNAAELRAALENWEARPASKLPSIAVLPFANMSSDMENEYFSDGLAEEILNLLAKIPALKVIARTSSFAFRGKEQDIRRIGEALGVSNVLEGSVRRLGNRIRVTAQLIAASDGAHLWSERFDREVSDIFALQDEIAAAITMALQIKLSPEAEPLRYVPKPAAYDAYLKARYLQIAVTPESQDAARRYYEQAIEIDPGFPLAHVGLGHYWMALPYFGRCLMSESVPAARATVQRALQIDPTLPEAHAALGNLAAFYDLDWETAEFHFSFPGAKQVAYPLTRPIYAGFLFLRGQIAEATKLARHAIEEDPLAVWPHMNLHAYLQAAGQYEEALQQLRKTLELNETLVPALVSIAMLHAHRGEFAEALQEARRAHAFGPWLPDTAAVLAAFLHREGNEAESQALAQSIGSGDAIGDARSQALFYLLTGDIDKGADWTEKAIEQRDPSMMYYLRFVACERLRASHRWPKIAQTLNLPGGHICTVAGQ